MPPANNPTFDAIEETWFTARDNYRADLKAANPDPARIAAVKENKKAAELAYLEAVRLGLAGAGMADALAALKAANAAVKDSRENGESIGRLLVKAKDATEKATKLVAKAGGG